MVFIPDKLFTSLKDCEDFLSDQSLRNPWIERWTLSESGLVHSEALPRYLYRGEPGLYPSTRSSALRPDIYKTLDLNDLSRLKKIKGMLVWLLTLKDDYALSKEEAQGFLQHYGLPTELVDFTVNPLHAFTFAGAGSEKEVCIGVMQWPDQSSFAKITQFWNHPWANRPRRQQAVGVWVPPALGDLKSRGTREALGLKWYRVSLTADEQDDFRVKQKELLEFSDDESASLLRFHITESVEVHGKMSPALSEWLLERIPIAARCFAMKAIEKADFVVNFRQTNQLASFDVAQETDYSRRYWGTDYPDQSFDRMRDWRWSDVGTIAADPRTYHSDLYV